MARHLQPRRQAFLSHLIIPALSLSGPVNISLNRGWFLLGQFDVGVSETYFAFNQGSRRCLRKRRA